MRDMLDFKHFVKLTISKGQIQTEAEQGEEKEAEGSTHVSIDFTEKGGREMRSIYGRNRH